MSMKILNEDLALKLAHLGFPEGESLPLDDPEKMEQLFGSEDAVALQKLFATDERK